MDFTITPWHVLFVSIILTGIIILAFILRKGGKVKAGPNGFEIQQGQTIIGPLIPSKYAKEFLSYGIRTMEHRNKMQDLPRTCLRNQMRAYEEAEIGIIAAFKRGFLKCLEGETLPIERVRREQRAFSHMMYTIMRDIKNTVRSWFYSNHYYAIGDLDWATYVKTKRHNLEHILTEEIELEWLSDIIPREKIQLVRTFEAEYIDEIIVNTFNKARIISIRNHEALKEEEQLYEAYVARLVGIEAYRNQ